MKQSSVSILLKIICVIIALTAPLTGHSNAYEQSIPEDHYRLARWDIPIVQLVITSAREDPHDENLLYIDATIEEVLRRGDPRLPHGPISAQWQTYRKMARHTFSDRAAVEPTGEGLLNELKGKNLICFIGSLPSSLIIQADACFADNAENRETLLKLASSKRLKAYLYHYASHFVLIFPLIGLLLSFISPRTSIFIATLAFPCGIYTLSFNKPYDSLAVYPALIFSAIVLAIGFVRWLNAIIKQEQKEKAAATLSDTTHSD